MSVRGRSITLVERRGTIDTHRLSTVALTRLEHTRAVVGGHVPCTSHHVVDVLTPRRRHTPSGVASPKAKLVGRHEVRPLKHLFKLPKSCREHQATNWISISIGTMRIELSPRIASRDVKLRQISCARNLNKVGRLNEMCSCNSTTWNDACPVAVL